MNPQAQDSVTEIIQHCDSSNLKQALINILSKVLTMIESQFNSQGAANEEQRDLIVHGFGGMLQVLIVKIGQDTIMGLQDMCTAIFATLTKVLSKDSCRLAGLLIMNGLLNSLDRAQIRGISENVCSVI